MKKVSITALSSVSPLGNGREEVLQSYKSEGHCLVYENETWMGRLPAVLRRESDALRSESSHYKSLDPSVLYALYAGREAVRQAGWEKDSGFGINVGSSRGATTLLEQYHGEFLEKGRVSTQASPATTLGNISSWLAHDLGSKGPDISHSITCSTALHALLNGLAWIQSGMSNKFLVGGAEAPLTPFTFAQMRALKIYSRAGEGEKFPCRALDMNKKGNTMVLGEGAAMACLEPGEVVNARAVISGVGYATEPLDHSVSLSTDAKCFQESMKLALGTLSPESVDAIVLHAPGTRKGDSSEVAAVEALFGKSHPALTTNKWKTGHTFGASGMLSLEMAVLMLEEQLWIPAPLYSAGNPPAAMNRILVNAVGFGGNAVSVLLERPSHIS